MVRMGVGLNGYFFKLIMRCLLGRLKNEERMFFE